MEHREHFGACGDRLTKKAMHRTGSEGHRTGGFEAIDELRRAHKHLIHDTLVVLHRRALGDGQSDDSGTPLGELIQPQCAIDQAYRKLRSLPDGVFLADNTGRELGHHFADLRDNRFPAIGRYIVRRDRPEWKDIDTTATIDRDIKFKRRYLRVREYTDE